MAYRYTQADVEAMSDAELDKLAGFLQGWTIGGDCKANNYWIDAEGEHTGLYVWWRMGRSYSPSHDRNRSGELLERLPVDFQIRRASEWQRVTVFGERLITVDGITARSETIAAVCALLALEGRLA